MKTQTHPMTRKQRRAIQQQLIEFEEDGLFPVNQHTITPSGDGLGGYEVNVNSFYGCRAKIATFTVTHSGNIADYKQTRVDGVKPL